MQFFTAAKTHNKTHLDAKSRDKTHMSTHLV